LVAATDAATASDAVGPRGFSQTDAAATVFAASLALSIVESFAAGDIVLIPGGLTDAASAADAASVLSLPADDATVADTGVVTAVSVAADAASAHAVATPGAAATVSDVAVGADVATVSVSVSSSDTASASGSGGSVQAIMVDGTDEFSSEDISDAVMVLPVEEDTFIATDRAVAAAGRVSWLDPRSWKDLFAR
jgi:hypothetical protein